MRYFVFPRYRNGEDMAPAGARKTDKVYISHAELADSIEGGIPYETEMSEDTLLADKTVEAIADTVTLADEIIAKDSLNQAVKESYKANKAKMTKTQLIEILDKLTE